MYSVESQPIILEEYIASEMSVDFWWTVWHISKKMGIFIVTAVRASNQTVLINVLNPKIISAFK
jgi:hypothetical protein